jgi:hypothetical protein
VETWKPVLAKTYFGHGMDLEVREGKIARKIQ